MAFKPSYPNITKLELIMSNVDHLANYVTKLSKLVEKKTFKATYKKQEKKMGKKTPTNKILKQRQQLIKTIQKP